MSHLGESFRITIFGASHREELETFLARRAPGRGAFATARKETDAPIFLSGVKNGVTCGGAVTAVIRNSDAHPGDYDALRHTPRPGHADFAARIKDGESVDLSGGGRFSGRLTAPLCVAGGIAMQLLERRGIRIVSHIASIAGVADEGLFPASTLGKPFPTLSEKRGEEMLDAIAKARADGDSVGGIVECAVLGVPAGLGDALFDGVESRLSAALFGIPAVKGVEFGAGFGPARCAAARITTLLCCAAERSSPRRTAAAAFSAASRRGLRSCSASASSRRRPLPGGSARSIPPPCAKP